MGWSYSRREKGKSIMEFFKQEFEYDKGDGRKLTILKCGVVHRREAYMAVKVDTAEGTSSIFALVCVLDYKRDYYNFGYKEMTEDMGPYYFNCPESILNILPDTTNSNSKAWRKTCREVIEKRRGGGTERDVHMHIQNRITNDVYRG